MCMNVFCIYMPHPLSNCIFHAILKTCINVSGISMGPFFLAASFTLYSYPLCILSIRVHYYCAAFLYYFTKDIHKCIASIKSPILFSCILYIILRTRMTVPNPYMNPLLLAASFTTYQRPVRSDTQSFLFLMT